MNPQNAIFCAMERLCPTLFYLCVFALCCTTAAMARANPDDFPEYDIMSANVNFWEQVYSTHSVNTSIIHDQHDLVGIVDALHAKLLFHNPDHAG